MPGSTTSARTPSTSRNASAAVRLSATTVDAPAGLGVDEASERLLFRGAQEAMRNVQKHAHARTARIVVQQRGDRIRLEVRDDGRGCDPVVVQGRVREGHLGLRLLDDLVSEAGGRLEVGRGPNGGTVFALDLPGGLLAAQLGRT